MMHKINLCLYISTKIRTLGLTAAALAILNTFTEPTLRALAQTEPGVSTGSCAGSAGIADTEATYKKQVAAASKIGRRSQAYIGALIDLGMHYNRQERYQNACTTLTQALSIIDAGALKPTPGSVSEKPPTVVQHDNGTVSATVNKPPAPYEETLEQLLPALVEAESKSNHLKEGEIHVKRLIAMANGERIHRIPNIIFAYNQYAEILTKMHRPADAAHYKKEAEKINSTIKGL